RQSSTQAWYSFGDKRKSPRSTVACRFNMGEGQFQQRFRALLQERGIEHARGRARTWQFKAKVDRLFWSLKRWSGGGLVVAKVDSIQQRLDDYLTWHNLYRPHAALDTLTPDEAERQSSRIQNIRIAEGGDAEPDIQVEPR
ncbi:MAG: hypothetical protein AAGH92_09665, partial [Planctomycetota bacterium]